MTDRAEPNSGDGDPVDSIIDYTRVLESEGGEWYVLGYSSNGKVIVRSSETYENEAWAREVAEELAPIKDEDTEGDNDA